MVKKKIACTAQRCVRPVQEGTLPSTNYQGCLDVAQWHMAFVKWKLLCYRGTAPPTPTLACFVLFLKFINI